MIKHYCDFCGEEITEIPNEIKFDSGDAACSFCFSNEAYECCDKCFQEAKAYFLEVVEKKGWK